MEKVILMTTPELEAIVSRSVEMGVQLAMNNQQQKVADEAQRPIKGIRGLAAYAGCSPCKAQELKNTGLVPFSRVGNRLLFYPAEVDAAFRAMGSGKGVGI